MKTPEERLASIKAFVTDPTRLEQWGAWRRYVADGGQSSWPRDGFAKVCSTGSNRNAALRICDDLSL